MASDDTSLMNSAIWKLAEFAKLRYPTQALLRACSLVAVNTRNATWFKVRGTFSKYAYQYAPPSLPSARVSVETLVREVELLRSKVRCSNLLVHEIGMARWQRFVVVCTSDDCPAERRVHKERG